MRQATTTMTKTKTAVMGRGLWQRALTALHCFIVDLSN
jgi:hypothetical protein